MAMIVVSSPLGVNGVKVLYIDAWCEQGMARVHTCIKQADMHRGVVGYGRACEQLIDPLALLSGLQGIEELSRFLGPANFRNFVQQRHRLSDLSKRAMNVNYCSLREVQNMLGYFEAACPGGRPEALEHRLSVVSNWKPELPPKRLLSICW